MKKVVSKLLILFCMTVLFGSLGCISVFAATVGQVLPSAESGWVRYDSNIANFVYTGSWSLVTDSQYYLGNTKTTTTPNDSVKFKFYGTKFRVMGAMGTTNASSVIVKVDGVQVGTFNCNQATLVRGCFMYEHAGMSVGTHLVELINNDSGSKNFTFDSLDIDDIGRLVDFYQPQNLHATTGNSSVSLNWNSEGAISYNVKRATTSGGVYTTIATTSAITYTDGNVTNGTTYYYVVSAVNSYGESVNSNEVSGTPNTTITPPATGGPALLRITMTNGGEKEYEMTGSEITTFINWYNGRAEGTGSPCYVIDKKYNKGPFTSRKDYIVFDKILDFEVMEY